LHFLVELAVVVGKTGRDIKKADAMDYVAGKEVLCII
jgi:2-keto-4-pentenoate hydratase/2-oxohepta-3-ene-1,7-dioic acid hydratase in catechol pathway